MARKNNYSFDRKRVIAFLDVDCFSIQIVRTLVPHLKGIPCATVRRPHPEWSRSVLISVSYEANNVCKGMTVSEAIEICPDIEILTESKIERFAEQKKEMSDKLFAVMKKFCGNDIVIQKMSVDDAFLDLTDKCDQFIEENYAYDQKFLNGLDVVIEGGLRRHLFANNKTMHRLKWAEAAVIMSDLKDLIESNGLICSIGISFNKLVSKICCKLNKPDAITIIASKAGIARVFETCPLSSCDGLGSNFGSLVQKELNITTLKQLRGFRRRFLIKKFNTDQGKFLWDVCRGINNSPVKYKTELETVVPSLNSTGFKKDYPRGIYCDDQKVFNDVKKTCKKMADKLNKILQEYKLIAHRIRIEFYTKNGQNLSTTFYLMSKSYKFQQIYETIESKFGLIFKNMRQYISGFTIIPVYFKSTASLAAISDLSEQMSQMTLQTH